MPSNLLLKPQAEVTYMAPETAPFTVMDHALALVFLGFTLTGIVLVARYILRVLKQDKDTE